MRPTVNIATPPEAGYLPLLAKALFVGDGDRKASQKFAESMPERVRKALVAPVLTSDGDVQGLANTTLLLQSFAPLLRNHSVFFKLLDGLITRLPLKTRVSFLTGSIAPGRVPEGKPIKVSRIAGDAVFVDAHKAAGILILSEEMIAWLSSGADNFLTTELRRAIGSSVDAAFFEIVAPGASSQASIGNAGDDALDDIGYLFNAVGLTAESRPIFAMSSDVARRASLLNSGGVRIFGDMTPLGGFLIGIPAIVSDALAPQTLALFDGQQLAGDVEAFDLKHARHAAIEIDTPPNSPPSASSTVISLWQQNLAGIRAMTYFGVAKLRASAMATVTDVEWGAGLNSPP